MDAIDLTIRKQLQKWAKGQASSPGARYRLLESAAAPRNHFYQHKPIKLPSFPMERVSWAMVYSLDRSITSSQLIR
jgi:hypothetical protein